MTDRDHNSDSRGDPPYRGSLPEYTTRALPRLDLGVHDVPGLAALLESAVCGGAIASRARRESGKALLREWNGSGSWLPLFCRSRRATTGHRRLRKESARRPRGGLRHCASCGIEVVSIRTRARAARGDGEKRERRRIGNRLSIRRQILY